MAKTTLMEAIARSNGNKAKVTMYAGTEDEFTLIAQELDVMVFRWWVIERDGHVWENKRKREDFMEHLRNHQINHDAKIWLPAESDEDAIDPEELLSALQTAAYELGRDGKCLAKSDKILRQEAQRTLEHLQDVLRRYHRL